MIFGCLTDIYYFDSGIVNVVSAWSTTNGSGRDGGSVSPSTGSGIGSVKYSAA
jgi:hypothetical protein